MKMGVHILDGDRQKKKTAVLDTYLSTALDDIKRANSGVGKTAGKDTSNHALCIVASVMNVTHFVCLVYLV